MTNSCKDCKHDKGKCVGASRAGSHRYCFEQKEVTNADRIREMTDEELANWIDQMFGRCDWCDNQCYDMDCVACIQRWLEKTAEVGK